jgi:transposase
MSRLRALSDEQWALIQGLLPSSDGRPGRNFRDSRLVIDGIIYRYRVGIPWRDLPEVFGPWQTVWKRHNRYSHDGTWDAILSELIAKADAAGLVDWAVSVDSTVNRAHQHATNTKRETVTGGSTELQEIGRRAA